MKKLSLMLCILMSTISTQPSDNQNSVSEINFSLPVSDHKGLNTETIARIKLHLIKAMPSYSKSNFITHQTSATYDESLSITLTTSQEQKHRAELT